MEIEYGGRSDCADGVILTEAVPVEPFVRQGRSEGGLPGDEQRSSLLVPDRLRLEFSSAIVGRALLVGDLK